MYVCMWLHHLYLYEQTILSVVPSTILCHSVRDDKGCFTLCPARPDKLGDLASLVIARDEPGFDEHGFIVICARTPFLHTAS